MHYHDSMCPQATVYVLDMTFTASMAYKFMVFADVVPYTTLTELLASEPQVSRVQLVLMCHSCKLACETLTWLPAPCATGVTVLAPGSGQSSNTQNCVRARSSHYGAGT